MAVKMTTNPFIGNLNIHIIRLKTGQDIICNIADCDEKKSIVTIECPLDIDVNVINDKKYVSFSPWIPLETVDENICKLRSSDILTFLKPKMSVMLRYVELYWAMVSYNQESKELSNNDYKVSIN